MKAIGGKRASPSSRLSLPYRWYLLLRSRSGRFYSRLVAFSCRVMVKSERSFFCVPCLRHLSIALNRKRACAREKAPVCVGASTLSLSSRIVHRSKRHPRRPRKSSCPTGLYSGSPRMSPGAQDKPSLRKPCGLDKSNKMTVVSPERAGFTLVETLAALAIASAIILSTSALIHQGVFFFDRGTRTVDQVEQLTLAIESLTRDFGAARFVVQKNANGTRAAFTGVPAGEGGQAKILLVTAGGRASGPQGEEVVSITVETGDELTQLVRRRSAWPGPRMRLEDAKLQDAVILLKGKLDMSFSFSELMQNGTLVWHDCWTGETGLPHSVRLNLRDGVTGAGLLMAAEFPVYADAPAACTEGKADCLSLAAKTNSGPGANSGEQQSTRAGTRE